MINNPKYFQVAFYIISPIVTFLAVAIAYLAIYKQSKPNVIVHYEPSLKLNGVGPGQLPVIAEIYYRI